MRNHAPGIISAGLALSLLLAGAAARYRPAVHAAEAPVSYSNQIAPIVFAHCTGCHHPEGAGPFSLLSYSDAKRWGPQILTVTQSRYMPPWLPEPGHGDFADDRRLSDHDRELLRIWVTTGMPQGDPAQTPPAPTYSSDWALGPPDLVLEMIQPFTTPASGADVFRNFVLPSTLREPRYIRAMEIKPGAGADTASVVHHANVLLDRTGSYRRQHPLDWQSGVPGMELTVDAGSAFDPDSHFLFWKPDTPAIEEPKGLEWRLDPGDDLVLNMHFKPTGKPETIRARIGLYFSKSPPTKQPMLLQLEHDAAIDIPAGARAFSIEDELKLPIAVYALGVYPHAHYLGKKLQAWATLPDGTRQWLVSIPDWDIDRQSVYRYRTPVLLPGGTVLHMHYVYDNSTANPRNPHDPPVRVKAGNSSQDEMGHLWLQVLPVDPVTNGKDSRLLLEEAWMQARLARRSDDPMALYNLAAASSELGHYAEAVALYRRILARSPRDVRTLTALGAALDRQGDWQQAAQAYKQALLIDSDSADARFDLASLQLDHEQYSEAEQNFRTLTAKDPADAASHAGLGAALSGMKQAPAARTEFESALRLDPRNRSAAEGLAEQEMDAGEFSDAVPHLKLAIEIRDDCGTRELLAMALAQLDKSHEAEEQLRQATKLCPADPGPHAMLSHLEGSEGNLADAIREQEAAIALNPKDPDSWNDLGVLHARANRIADARRDFNRALELAPHHPEALANLKRLQLTSHP